MSNSTPRLSREDAILLLESASTADLALRADRERVRRHGRRTHFTHSLNLNPTNVCENRCELCAFWREREAGDAYAMTLDEARERLERARGGGLTELHIVGGCDPAADLDYHLALIRMAREILPGVLVQGLTAVEIDYHARRQGLTIAETLRRLREAGLNSLPGGGAEILVDEVRRTVSPRKITTEQWLEVMETAHSLGLKTTATMVYGLGETAAQRVEHLLRIRDLQDCTGGFTAFIPWSFQPDRTQLVQPKAGGMEYLRVVALARLTLDNVPHLQAGWVTEGPDMAQLALSYGADDFGGVLMEEKVVKATGVSFTLAREHLLALIRQTGLTPAQRSTQYDLLREF